MHISVFVLTQLEKLDKGKGGKIYMLSSLFTFFFNSFRAKENQVTIFLTLHVTVQVGTTPENDQTVPINAYF